MTVDPAAPEDDRDGCDAVLDDEAATADDDLPEVEQ